MVIEVGEFSFSLPSLSNIVLCENKCLYRSIIVMIVVVIGCELCEEKEVLFCYRYMFCLRLTLILSSTTLWKTTYFSGLSWPIDTWNINSLRIEMSFEKVLRFKMKAKTELLTLFNDLNFRAKNIVWEVKGSPQKKSIEIWLAFYPTSCYIVSRKVMPHNRQFYVGLCLIAW